MSKETQESPTQVMVMVMSTREIAPGVKRIDWIHERILLRCTYLQISKLEVIRVKSIVRDNESEHNPVQEDENNGPSNISSSIATSDHDRNYRYMQYLSEKERRDPTEKDEAIADLQAKIEKTWT